MSVDDLDVDTLTPISIGLEDLPPYPLRGETTDQLVLTSRGEKSDRVMLENRMDTVALKSDLRIKGLERRMNSHVTWLVIVAAVTLITLGMASASFAVQMWRIHVMADKGELK